MTKKVDLFDVGGEALTRLVEEGKLDMSVGAFFKPAPGLRRTPLFRFSLMVIRHIDKPGSPEHALAAYNAYNAYFGTYTVDAKRHVVIHHVEGSMAPDYTDTDQPRPFTLKGDRLEIGDGKTYRCVLERVR